MRGEAKEGEERKVRGMNFNSSGGGAGADRRPAVRAFQTVASEATRENKQRELLRQQQVRRGPCG